MTGNKRAQERFIPFRKKDLVKMCLEDRLKGSGSEKQFKNFCTILESLFHQDFQICLEKLKNAYAPFDPDADTRMPFLEKDEEKELYQNELVEELKKVLDDANFQALSSDDLSSAMNRTSLFHIRLHVDFEDFKDVLFFKRGGAEKTAFVPGRFGLGRKKVTFFNCERVLVYIRFKGREHFEQKKKTMADIRPGSVVIKLFANVPEADLEMLFPNCRVRMRTVDKLFIGIPAVISGAVVIATKLGASLLLVVSILAFWLGLTRKSVEINQHHLVALGVGLFSLGAFFYKQFSKFKNRKLRFMKTLTENLYFKNLDNNAGVFFRLVDAAEEEEFKEAVLAYHFLEMSDTPLTARELDERVEAWLWKKWGCSIDFEVSDALEKLIRLKIATSLNGRYSAVKLETALGLLDEQWDGLFSY